MLYFLFLTIFLACTTEEENHNANEIIKNIEVPPHFQEISYPSDNVFTSDRWQMGKKLFYDTRLSIDNTISCGSCHKQSTGFADNVSLTPGVKGNPATRNAPSLANVAYHPYFTREGGVPTLEMQILIPISEHNEFGFNMVRLVERLSMDTVYQRMAQEAYGRDLDAFCITRALSTFERSLISGNSKYDHHIVRSTPLTFMENLGKELFFSERTQCSTCHNGFNFTNYAFANNGLYEEYPDSGRYRLTEKKEDLALFKIPSLRLSGVTPPYMHDGSIATLSEVIEHYNQGGKNHINKSPLIKKLHLNVEEKCALVAFLNTLTDEIFLKNKYYSE